MIGLIDVGFRADAMAAEVGGGPLLPPREETAAEPTSARASRGVSFHAQQVSRRFGAARVLDALSLEARAGEFIAVVGRSGCGKSTFLRLLAGLDAPDAGSILFDDERRARRPDDVRVMFQEPRLLPWRSALDNVLIGLGEGRGDRDGKERAQRALASVGLADRAQAWPSELSGGQRQRVALARALVSRPGALALDEPFGALDALTRVEMHALLEQVWREEGFTALMVTHDVAEAVALADRVVLFENGGVTLDVTIDLPRPRRRGEARAAEIEQDILDRLMR
jgi:sulfonate transport system ATP-binding protein